MTQFKLICFDFDGVLFVDKDIHFESLNFAIEVVLGKDYIISRKDHDNIYNGIPSIKKLEILSDRRCIEISKQKMEKILQVKKNHTEKLLLRSIRSRDYNDLIVFLKDLRSFGHILAITSNSVRSTVDLFLNELGISYIFDIIISNEDVKNSKPDPEMYLKAMELAKTDPRNTLILEDSPVGIEAAKRSKAYIWPCVDGHKDFIHNPKFIEFLKDKPRLKVLIPMAGNGSRFEKAGYSFPKPFIDVKGEPMIVNVIKNLDLDAHYIFIAKREHVEKYMLEDILKIHLGDNFTIIKVSGGTTEGAACTALLAEKIINDECPLIIANSDQILEWKQDNLTRLIHIEDPDGIILTFESTHPKWSYAKVENNEVVEVAEKKPISNHATCGIYYWKRGSDFVKYAKSMIEKNIRTNGEFYICPVYNQAIKDKKIIKILDIEKMWGIGTPEDLNYFLTSYKG